MCLNTSEKTKKYLMMTQTEEKKSRKILAVRQKQSTEWIKANVKRRSTWKSTVSQPLDYVKNDEKHNT